MSQTNHDASLIWLRPEPSERKPRYTRDQIARVALEIADTDGFDTVTMKRIAAELGAATMTLYYYVRTKADIVALMHDAILEDILIPDDQLPEDWRSAVAAIAYRSRDVLIRHPWSISALNDAQFGPNAMRHYEQSLAALKATSLTAAEKVTITGIFDDYVVGSATHAVETQQRLRTAAHDPGLVRDALTHGRALLASGDFPQLAALADAQEAQREHESPADPVAQLSEQFATGLEALLDGLEQRMVEPRGARPVASSV